MMLAEIVLTCITISDKLERRKKDRTDKIVEEAQNERSSVKDAIDEGIENIMSYSVNGRTGFEGGNNER